MIPELIDIGHGSPWPVLPPGIHNATIDEIAARFATTPHRAWLFGGFVRAVESLRTSGCSVLFLDGSFTTAKDHPEDFDGCWDHTGMDFSKLDPVLCDFNGKREVQKAKYFGEMFPAYAQSGAGTFVDFFQVEKMSGKPKGILRIQLTTSTGAAA